MKDLLFMIATLVAIPPAMFAVAVTIIWWIS